MLIFYLDIEVEDVADDVKPSYYSVSIYVADNKVVKSTKSKPRLSGEMGMESK